MNILKDKKFKATSWLDETKKVEGALHLLDLKTLSAADPQINRNGYLMVIKDNQDISHLIAPDTLEII